MAVLREGIGPAEHEQSAIEHVAGIKDPGRRHVHDVALENLGTDQKHQPYNEPCGGLAHKGAHTINEMKKPLNSHGNQSNRGKQQGHRLNRWP